MYQVLPSAPGDTEVNAILFLFRSSVKGGNWTHRQGSDMNTPAGPAARPEAAGEVPRALRTQAAPLPSSEAVFSQFNGQCA